MSRRARRATLLEVNPEKLEMSEGYIKSAREQSSQRNFIGGLENIALALSSVPDHPEALLIQACIRASQGRPELASKELEKFVSLNPQWPKTKSKLGGWVKKDRNQVVGKSQRRWFYLRDKFLFYYKEPTDVLPLSGYVIENALVAQTALGNGKDTTQFSLVIPPTISYTIDAFQEQARGEWITVLIEANHMDPFESAVRFFTQADQVLPLGLTSEPGKISESSHQGFLYKRGDNNTDWKIRWFSLQGTLLIYSASEDSKPLGSIDVRNCRITQGVDGDADFPFQLITPLRTYYLDSEYAEATREWIHAIFRAQDAASKINTSSDSDPNSSSSSSDTILGTSLPAVLDNPAATRQSTFPFAWNKSAPSSSNVAGPATITPTGSVYSDVAVHDEPKPASINIGSGRKLGGVGDATSSNVSVTNRRITTHIDSTTPTSSFGQVYEKNAVEMRTFTPPSETLVALSAFNENAELKRNRDAIARRANMDKSHSQMLREPLLNEESEEVLELDGREKEKSSLSCCSIL